MFFSKKLKKIKGIQHCFFSRKGGCSSGLYKYLNCGRGSKDNKNNIRKNLNIVSRKMKVKRKNLILMHQTHSNKVFEIKKNYFKSKIYADAMLTRNKGLALGVVTADCVPILLYDKKSKFIGCIHAGWKGAITNIIKNTISRINKIEPNSKIYASIGPCIGKKNYEVDNDFFDKFILKSPKNKKYFTKKNKSKKLFNLRLFVADKLAEQKVRFDHVNYDTFEEKNKFFSYRRSKILNQSDYGRCISAISLV